MSQPNEVQAVIIGAGPAGLATAACLRRRGIAFELLERSGNVGNAWRNHYRRLHLHTTRDHSALPYTPFPANVPTYPARQDVVDYLEAYAAEHQIAPRFEANVRRVSPLENGWLVETDGEAWQCQHVVFCTGYNRVPVEPEWPGRDEFEGPVVHSSRYRTGADFAGQRVLVVGVGNSGAEIALDLLEQGAKPSICIRSPINVVSRDIFGIPAQIVGLRTAWLPQGLVDATMRVLSRLVFGDLRPWGIKRRTDGPLSQISKGSIPVIDVGTIARIKTGEIQVVPGIERFTARGVRCVDGQELACDAVVLATGYRTGLQTMLDGCDDALDAKGHPVAHPPAYAAPGLHFVGFANVASGLFRLIGIEAPAVGDTILNSQRN